MKEQELKTQILQSISDGIKEYISQNRASTMFVNNKDDLKKAINQKLQLQFNEQLQEGEPEQISETVSAILESYMKTHKIEFQEQSDELSGKFDPFYQFLENLDEKKLGLRLVEV